MRIRLLLCGDVMLGRGIDQILPYPSQPNIYESFVKDARQYIELAERKSGKINYPVSFGYVWGDALAEIAKVEPDLKIVNLETTITKSENYLAKGINYRMNPENIEVLKVFGVDCCLLANNHIFDWGEEGLIETIRVLKKNKIQTVGAGKDIHKAKKPAIFNLKKGRIIIFAYAHYSSGVSHNWIADKNRAGLNLLENLTERKVEEIKNEIVEFKQKQDFVIFSIHWGPNWGYEINPNFVDFAHALIDFAGADLIFGHSSHHFKGFEVYKNKLIIYGAGDFINDYEGIAGYEEYRGDLSIMYFPEVDLNLKSFVHLTLVPMKIKKFRLNTPSNKDIDWIIKILKKQSKFEGKFVRNDYRLKLYPS